MDSKKTTIENRPDKAPDGCVPFDVFKTSFGPAAHNYSDKEIDTMRIMFDKFADQHFNLWIKKINNEIVTDRTA